MTLSLSTAQQTEGLLKRIEAATGPDREIDVRLDCMVDGTNFDALIRDGYAMKDFTAPAYTASTDTALALVERVLPEANCYGVEKDTHGWTAYVSRNHVPSGHWLKEAGHQTAPLAILAALLAAISKATGTP